MAEYSLQDNGKVVVLNTGRKDGKFKIAKGKTKYKDPEGDPGHLRVSFFLFFYSDYNVMMVDENYQIPLVGSKSENRGYDVSKLIWVYQSRNIEQLGLEVERVL